MTVPPQENQEQPKVSDKEHNFRLLEQKYQKELEKERSARMEAERAVQESKQKQPEEDDDNEPYVDRKKLNRELNKFGQQAKQETTTEIQKAVQTALNEERKANWIKTNADFYDVLQHAEKLALADPELAETILEMPNTFERQKLVYKNIKALNLHKPKAPESTIQQKVDANRKSPYYQPSGTGTSPYSAAGDFSKSGQKNAYDQMQALKQRLGYQ